MVSSTANPAPAEQPKSRSRSLRARSRGLIVLAVIAAFAGVTPLAYIYTLWSATALFPRLASWGIPPPPATTVHYALLVYAIAETAFGIIYHGLAISLQRSRPSKATPKSAREVRDVVKQVFEANMQEPGSSPGSTSSSRRNSVADLSGLHTRGKTSMDSGYATDSSDNGTKDALPPILEQSETTYSFLSPKLKADDPRAIDFREAARHWFHGIPFSSLTRQHVQHWMASSLYGAPLEELVQERRNSISEGRDITTMPRVDDIGRDKLETVERSVDLWESRSGTSLPRTEERKPEAVIRLTLDPVRVLSRPLALYCLIYVVQQVYRRKLCRWGFEEQYHGGQKYFVRTPTGWAADEDSAEDVKPLVFLHGLGIGLVQYAPILNKFANDKAYARRPIALLVQPHLSMSLFNPRYLTPPSAKESSASLIKMSEANGFKKSGVTVLSHSKGTIVHGWFIKAAPKLVTRSLLVDPVCFALWEPSLPYNFLYAAAKSPMQLLMRYFVARELGVANTLQRHFDWISSMLRPIDIPNVGDSSKVAVFLAERDAIVDSSRVAAYLKGEGWDESNGVRVWKKQRHGESMMGHGESFEAVMQWVRNDNKP